MLNPIAKVRSLHFFTCSRFDRWRKQFLTFCGETRNPRTNGLHHDSRSATALHFGVGLSVPACFPEAPCIQRLEHCEWRNSPSRGSFPFTLDGGPANPLH
ncbi:hypothetical protein Y032_0003g1328 [Ancylostoma ceylanicum]|uniref:Uncharacterized protein n=1 Tax=Ancylostoma ceylanicum TaxID=53326 RepID=A0A016VXA5_9BILA|nr:hypothetical protein Y032_0003g1328 [Ancylostoma ceylanicum]